MLLQVDTGLGISPQADAATPATVAMETPQSHHVPTNGSPNKSKKGGFFKRPFAKRKNARIKQQQRTPSPTSTTDVILGIQESPFARNGILQDDSNGIQAATNDSVASSSSSSSSEQFHLLGIQQNTYDYTQQQGKPLKTSNARAADLIITVGDDDGTESLEETEIVFDSCQDNVEALGMNDDVAAYGCEPEQDSLFASAWKEESIELFPTEEEEEEMEINFGNCSSPTQAAGGTTQNVIENICFVVPAKEDAFDDKIRSVIATRTSSKTGPVVATVKDTTVGDTLSEQAVLEDAVVREQRVSGCSKVEAPEVRSKEPPSLTEEKVEIQPKVKSLVETSRTVTKPKAVSKAKPASSSKKQPSSKAESKISVAKPKSKPPPSPKKQMSKRSDTRTETKTSVAKPKSKPSRSPKREIPSKSDSSTKTKALDIPKVKRVPSPENEKRSKADTRSKAKTSVVPLSSPKKQTPNTTFTSTETTFVLPEEATSVPSPKKHSQIKDDTRIAANISVVPKAKPVQIPSNILALTKPKANPTPSPKKQAPKKVHVKTPNLFWTKTPPKRAASTATILTIESPVSQQIYLLLLQPESKLFELIQLAYPVATTTIGGILGMIPENATETALGKQAYVGLSRATKPQDESTNMIWSDMQVSASNTSADSAGITEGEILVAIPTRHSASRVAHISKQILSNPRIQELLSKSAAGSPAKIVPSSTSSSGSKRRTKKSKPGKHTKSSSRSGVASTDVSIHAVPSSVTIAATSITPGTFVATPATMISKTKGKKKTKKAGSSKRTSRSSQCDDASTMASCITDDESVHEQSVQRALLNADITNAEVPFETPSKTLVLRTSVSSSPATPVATGQGVLYSYTQDPSYGGRFPSLLPQRQLHTSVVNNALACNFASWSKSFEQSVATTRYGHGATMTSTGTALSAVQQTRRRRKAKLIKTLTRVCLAVAGAMILRYFMDPNGYTANSTVTAQRSHMGLVGLVYFLASFLCIAKFQLLLQTNVEPANSKCVFMRSSATALKGVEKRRGAVVTATSHR